MKALQEVLTDPGAFRAIPEGKESREARVMIPASRLKEHEARLRKIFSMRDSTESFNISQEVWAAWEKFKGVRR